jgi:hypothetical protein
MLIYNSEKQSFKNEKRPEEKFSPDVWFLFKINQSLFR